jgi:hypothetical protein
MKKPIVVLTIVAAAAMTFTAGAEANHRKVFCGNFSGQGMDPHVARKPARCDVTRLGRNGTVVKLRSMRWPHWRERAKGRGLVNGKQRTVRLRRGRPCGRHGEFSVYSQMKIVGRGTWRRILHCGD